MKIKVRFTLAIILIAIIALVMFGCAKKQDESLDHVDSCFTYFDQIPELTDHERSAIETIRKKFSKFTYGMVYSSESFPNDDGTVGGFYDYFCQWLTQLFGIPFQLRVLEPKDLVNKLDTGEVDFSSYWLSMNGHGSKYIRTELIQERKLISVRMAGSERNSEIVRHRKLKIGYDINLQVDDSFRAAIADISLDRYDAIPMNTYEDAYNNLKSGKIDSFVVVRFAEPYFLFYNDVIIEDFFPLIFLPLYMYTANPELEPIITVVDKALKSGALLYLSNEAAKGFNDFIRYSAYKTFTPEEKVYIQNNPKIKIGTTHSNYPFNFYNWNDKQWQGIYFDMLDEISKYIDIEFELVNTASDAESVEAMLKNQEIAMLPDLEQTPAREEFFIWSDKVFLTNYYTLVSKIDYRNIQFHEILNSKVGVYPSVAGDNFKRWYKNHNEITSYPDINKAFTALEKGEVNLVMTTKMDLLRMTHFDEKVGFKANITFDLPINTRLAFNKDNAILKSIIEKSLEKVTINTSYNYWLERTYDYTAKMARQKVPWLIAATVLSLLVLALVITVFYQSQKEKQKLKVMIDEVKEANRLKNISIASMEGILNNIQIMIYVTEIGTGKILFINDMMKKFFNFKGDEVIGKYCFNEFRDNANQPCAFCPCIELDKDPDKVVVWEETLQNGDLIVRHSDCYIDWPTGEKVHLQHTVDLTELVKAKQEAERSNLYKSSFLATMSHEIRTPMNTILGTAELQLQEKNLSPVLNEAFTKISESGDLLMRIINDILDLSKIEAGRLELYLVNYNMSSLLNDVISVCKFYYDSKPVIFTADVTPDTPHDFFGDELRVKQILNNILSNAFKYTKDGNVHLTISSDNSKRETESLVYITFTIADTGYGMTEDQISKLFDEYTRFNLETNRTTTGTGLGMSITKRLVALMDGVISVESVLGKGSTFTVTIPQKVTSPANCGKDFISQLHNFSAQGAATRRKIQFVRQYMPYGSVLVVDDVESNLYVTKGMLNPYGLRIDTVTSGYEAIEKIRNGHTYDIIFMDHMMPILDGMQTTKNLRAMGYTGKIVALTANALVGQSELFMQNGFDGYIAKPIDSRELNMMLNKFVLRKKPGEKIEDIGVIPKSEKRYTIPEETEVEDEPLDVEIAKYFILDAEKLVKVLEEVYGKLDNLGEDDIQNYTIAVHGLKSALNNVNEKTLSSHAQRLEQASKETNIKVLQDETFTFINDVRFLITKLNRYIKDTTES